MAVIRVLISVLHHTFAHYILHYQQEKLQYQVHRKIAQRHHHIHSQMNTFTDMFDE